MRTVVLLNDGLYMSFPLKVYMLLHVVGLFHIWKWAFHILCIFVFPPQYTQVVMSFIISWREKKWHFDSFFLTYFQNFCSNCAFIYHQQQANDNMKPSQVFYIHLRFQTRVEPFHDQARPMDILWKWKFKKSHLCSYLCLSLIVGTILWCWQSCCYSPCFLE